MSTVGVPECPGLLGGASNTSVGLADLGQTDFGMQLREHCCSPLLFVVGWNVGTRRGARRVRCRDECGARSAPSGVNRWAERRGQPVTQSAPRGAVMPQSNRMSKRMLSVLVLFTVPPFECRCVVCRCVV